MARTSVARLAVLVGLLLLVGGVLVLVASGRSGGGPASRPSSRPQSPGPESPGGELSGGELSGSELPGSRAVRVLEEWQEARSRAYAEGGVGALRRLHAPGSEAGRRDVAVLRAWTSRGIGLDLVTETDRLSVLVSRPHLVVVRQRARVRGVAVVAGERRALPEDAWTWQRVTLRQVDGRWVLSAAAREPGGSPREPP